MLHIYIPVTPPIAATPTIPNGGVAAAPNGSGASCPMERPSASLPALEAGRALVQIASSPFGYSIILGSLVLG
jgi:hypothetical protein